MRLSTIAAISTLGAALAGCGGSPSGNAEPADWTEAPTPSAPKIVNLKVTAPPVVRRARATLAGSAPRAAIVTVDGDRVRVDDSGAWKYTVPTKLGANSYLVAAALSGHTTAEEVVEITRKRSDAEIARAAVRAAESRARAARAQAGERQAKAERQSHDTRDGERSRDQDTYAQLDDLAIEIDAALGAAVDAALGAGPTEGAAARLRSLYRQVRDIADPLLVEDSPFTIPANLIAGAAYNGRAALRRGEPDGVARQRREVNEGRRGLAEAVAE